MCFVLALSLAVLPLPIPWLAHASTAVLAPKALAPTAFVPTGVPVESVPVPGDGDEAVAGAPSGYATQITPYPQPATAATLFFVMDATVTTADGGRIEAAGVMGSPAPLAVEESVLGRLFDTNVARFTPGLDTSAVKIHATPEVVATCGDVDGDGDLWEIHWEDIDALGVRRLPWHPAVTRTADLIFSTRHDWGWVDPFSVHDQPGALDGDLFTLRRDADGLGFHADSFLSERLLLEALGQLGDPLTDGVDVDAFTMNPPGDLYVSFREAEWVAGEWLQPGGIAGIPHHALLYDFDDNVREVEPGCAVVVLDADEVDALLVNSGLTRASGNAVTHLGNLQGLAVDPAGGTLPPSAASSVTALPANVMAVPHLLFVGEKIGPTVLTTRDGGRLATLDGHTLGANPMHGAALGLGADVDAPGHDLGGLLVMPRPEAQMCLDVTAGQIDLALDRRVEFVLGGATPHGVIALLVTLGEPGSGAQLVSHAAPAEWVHPDLYVASPAAVFAGRADGQGRLLLGIDVPAALMGPLWIIGQAFDPTRTALSPPAAIWAPGI